MSQIQTHSGTDNARLRFKPRDTCLKPVSFKANICTDGQANVVTLRDFEAVLATLDTGKLFEATMVDLNLPGIQGVKGSLLDGHIQAAGGPVFRVAVCADCPKNLDPAIPFEVNQTSLNWNKDLADRTVAAAVDTDFPVALELRQPVPFQAAQQFEIRQPAVPTIKHHQLRLKSTLFGLFTHVLEVVILAQTILDLVVKPKITRQPTLAIGPHQRDQVDTLHHGMVLARPVPTDTRHLQGIRFVQSRIIDDQHAFCPIHQ